MLCRTCGYDYGMTLGGVGDGHNPEECKVIRESARGEIGRSHAEIASLRIEVARLKDELDKAEAAVDLREMCSTLDANNRALQAKIDSLNTIIRQNNESHDAEMSEALTDDLKAVEQMEAENKRLREVLLAIHRLTKEVKT